MYGQDLLDHITRGCGDAHTIIVSGEDFCTLTDLSFLEFLKKNFEIEIYFFLRRQDDWLMSWYNQNVRWPHDEKKYKLSPREFLNTISEYFWLYYDDLGLRWCEYLDIQNVHFCLMKGNTAEAFLRAVLPDVAIEPRRRDNDSISPAALEILRNLDLMPLRPGLRMRLIDAAARTADESHHKKYIYSVHQRQAILERFAESNRRAAQLFFGRDELFDMALPEDDTDLFQGMS